jgi:RNA polymerase primary sigma factor
MALELKQVERTESAALQASARARSSQWDELESGTEQVVYEEASAPEDSVRLYLSEMGAVPLLTRHGEIGLARGMERGIVRMRNGLARTPWMWNKLKEIRGRLAEDPAKVRPWVEAGETADVVKAGSLLRRRLNRVAKLMEACERYVDEERPRSRDLVATKRAYAWRAGRMRVEAARHILELPFRADLWREWADEFVAARAELLEEAKAAGPARRARRSEGTPTPMLRMSPAEIESSIS